MISNIETTQHLRSHFARTENPAIMPPLFER